jgi:hypothetical protein
MLLQKRARNRTARQEDCQAVIVCRSSCDKNQCAEYRGTTPREWQVPVARQALKLTTAQSLEQQM